MLRFLTLKLLVMMVIQTPFCSYAEELDNIVNDLLAKQKEIFTQDVGAPDLLIFVSTSMPKNLLKSYYKEASKYGASLVFKGLPNRSFSELHNLMQEIYVEGNEAGAFIDDEAFAKFGVNKVPSFVLYREEHCFEGSSCRVIYDKILGNIGTKIALEKFADDGDLKNHAKAMLK